VKKLAAILLLALLLFNIAGYRILFNILEQKATARLENKIDAGNYSEDQLVEVQIPLSMPYYSDKDYESVYGETDWNGKHYRYVKRKITNNTLYLLCLPHEEKNAIVTAKNELTKSVNDLSTDNPTQKQAPSVIKLLISDYINSENKFSLNSFVQSDQSWTIKDISIHNPFTPLTPAQPPEWALLS
jgi:hypothetical protein